MEFGENSFKKGYNSSDNNVDCNLQNIIDIFKIERNKLIQRFQYESAIYLSDKIIAINGMNKDDALILTLCFFLSKQYHRAIHFIQHNHLHEIDVQFSCILVKCLVNNIFVLSLNNFHFLFRLKQKNLMNH